MSAIADMGLVAYGDDVRHYLWIGPKYAYASRFVYETACGRKQEYDRRPRSIVLDWERVTCVGCLARRDANAAS